ncbi:MAG: hypothetical protein WBN68_06925 [Sedimenticolaceae bacterium]
MAGGIAWQVSGHSGDEVCVGQQAFARVLQVSLQLDIGGSNFLNDLGSPIQNGHHIFDVAADNVIVVAAPLECRQLGR